MSLYGLDESVEKLLKPEAFQDGFSAKEFIEKLSHSAKTTDEDRKELDPKPYIRTFEAVLKDLRSLERKVTGEEQEAAQEVYHSELTHSNNMINLGNMITTCMTDFTSLEDTVGSITSATSSLTDKLDVLSVQYEQTISSTLLIKSYLSFVRKGSSTELNRMWENSSISQRRKCASIVRQLQGLSRRIGNRDAQFVKPHEEIDKFAEHIEKDLLSEFDNAYLSADMAAMKESASMLTDFNGGASVVQIFVNQHDFFIVQEKLVDTSRMDDNEMWVRMSDPESSTEEFETAIQELMDEIKNGVVSETDIIARVFPNPVMVFKVFLQRIFAQRIQQQLEAYFQVAENMSTLAYLRALHISYAKVGGLVKHFKDWFSQQLLDNDGELMSLLDQNFADIFLPFIQNARYFETEKKNLQEIISSTLQRFNELHAHQKHQHFLQRDQSILGRFSTSGDGSEQSQEAGETNGNGGSSGHEKGRIGQFMRAVRLERANSSGTAKGGNDNSNSTNNSNNRPNSNIDNYRTSTEINLKDLEINYESIQKILSAFIESVSRDLELSHQPNIKHDAQVLLQLLVDSVGHNYIDIALEEALSTCSDDQRGNISLNYLKVIPTANGSIQLISTFAQTVLFSMAKGSESIQNNMTTTLNSYVSSAEEMTNSILRHTIELTSGKISYILGKQKKKDFLPRQDEPTDRTTLVCDEIKELLAGVYGIASECLDGTNLETFLQEIGFSLRQLLLQHLRNFTISPNGGLILIR